MLRSDQSAALMMYILNFDICFYDIDLNCVAWRWFKKLYQQLPADALHGEGSLVIFTLLILKGQFHQIHIIT